MSLAKRKEVIAFCMKENIPILEDNPYSRLRFSGKTLPTLFSLNHSDFPGSNIVTEIVSFSKILGPGMRMAFIKGPEEVIAKMESWQQKVNVTPDCVTQRVTAAFLEKGFYAISSSGYMWLLQTLFRQEVKLLDHEMPVYVTWTHPKVASFLWLGLPRVWMEDDIFVKPGDHNFILPAAEIAILKGRRKNINCLS